MVEPAPRDAPTPDEAGFRDWASTRMSGLRRKAFLLSGDWHKADDLVQQTLMAMYASWPRIAKGSNLDGYASRVLVHKHLDERRRPWRREHAVDRVPDQVDDRSRRAFAEVDDHDGLLAEALADLPDGQRVVLVLRFADDLSLETIARLTDLPVGTVKSRLSRGTDAVRSALVRRQHPVALAASTPATHPIGDSS